MDNSTVQIALDKLINSSYMQSVKPSDIWFLSAHLPDDVIMIYTAPNTALGHAMAIDRQLTAKAILEIENIEAFDKQGNPL